MSKRKARREVDRWLTYASRYQPEDHFVFPDGAFRAYNRWARAADYAENRESQ